MYRPTTLQDFVGQARIVEQLEVSMVASKKLNKALPHVLLYGPRGTGKTTLAHIVARHADGKLVEVSPFTLRTEEDVFRMFNNNLRKGTHTVFLVDEIHRLSAKTAEVLYQPMERFTFIMGGKNRMGKPMAYKFAPFTIVGATTNPGDLPEPFRDRFGLVLAMDYYTEPEMAEIVSQAARQQDYPVEEEAIWEIVHRSRNNPRLANTYLDRCNDYRVVSGSKMVDRESAITAFEKLQINEMGLSREDMKYLSLLYEAQRPVGLASMETALGIDARTITETVEPFLMQKGLVIVTPSGRTLTDTGIVYFLSQEEDAGVEPDTQS